MSSFAGRELLNPANVMEASYDAGTTLQQDNGLNFLGKEVDTGVRAGGEKQRQSNRTVPEPSPARSPAQTTIMAVQYDGGVIVGADSRVSTGARLRACPAARLWGRRVALPQVAAVFAAPNPRRASPPSPQACTSPTARPTRSPLSTTGSTAAALAPPPTRRQEPRSYRPLALGGLRLRALSASPRTHISPQPVRR